MSTIIKDGTGTGNNAKVDTNNRLQTKSVSVSEESNALLEDKGFLLDTGAIPLTSGNESAIFYLKNNGASSIKITKIIINIGNSTGGTGDFLFSIGSNPDSGTIIDIATDGFVINRTLGSSRSLDVDFYSGFETATCVGDDIPAPLAESQRVTIDVSVEVPTGQSLYGLLTPPTGNTALSISTVLTVFENGGE